jgi:hypothetical protein
VLRGWVDTRAIVRLEGLRKFKKKSDLIGRRRGLPDFSIVPQPTALQHVHLDCSFWCQLLSHVSSNLVTLHHKFCLEIWFTSLAIVTWQQSYWYMHLLLGNKPSTVGQCASCWMVRSPCTNRTSQYQGHTLVSLWGITGRPCFWEI